MGSSVPLHPLIRDRYEMILTFRLFSLCVCVCVHVRVHVHVHDLSAMFCVCLVEKIM